MSKTREIISDAGYGILASSVDGQPKARPMAFVISEDGRLLSSTYDISGKVAEMTANEKVEVCFVDSAKNHLRVEGRVDVSTDSAKRALLLELNPRVKRHFSGPEDPHFVVLEITPTQVRWTPPGFSEYEVGSL